MCAYKRLSARQEHALSKMGLMPLSNMRKINQRFGIPMSILESLNRENGNNQFTRLAMVERFEKNPANHHLLEHPKLWALARIKRLAPMYTNNEIYQILKAEAEEKNHGTKAVYRAPTEETVMRTIKRLSLRSEDEKIEIAKRIRAIKKPSNNFPLHVKKRMIEIAQEIISDKRAYQREHIRMPDEDTRQDVLILFSREANNFQFAGNDWNKLEVLWAHYVYNRIKLRTIDALRRTGPYQRNGQPRKQRLALSETLEKNGATTSFELPLELPKPKVPLTARERQVFEMHNKGMRRKQIASELGITVGGVAFVLRKLKQLI